MSHPTMGAWIEIFSPILLSSFFASHPTMGAWIEIEHRELVPIVTWVAPHDGCVD